MWSTGCKERVGQQASWGPGVPGCVRQRGSKAAALAGEQSAHTGRAHVDKLRGSWVPSLAVCTSSGKPESDKPQGQHQHLEDACGTTQGSRQGEQRTTHALPAGNLHPASRMHQGWAREGTGTSTGAPPAGSLISVGSASMARWATGDDKVPKSQQAPHVCTHWHLGSGGSRSCRPRAKICNKSALEAGL